MTKEEALSLEKILTKIDRADSKGGAGTSHTGTEGASGACTG